MEAIDHDMVMQIMISYVTTYSKSATVIQTLIIKFNASMSASSHPGHILSSPHIKLSSKKDALLRRYGKV